MGGIRMRNAAHRAFVSNPVTSRPWVAPAAYTNSTALRLGQIVSANGNWYVVVIAGTTNASGTGPTSTTAHPLVTDGTVSFAYIGGAVSADAGEGAPTLSIVTTNPALGLNWYPVGFPNTYRVRGGTPAAYLTNYYQISTFQGSSGVNHCQSATVSTCCDDSKVALFLPANSSCRVIVDGRYLQPGNYNVSVDSWLIIDWTATTGRKVRTYEVECFKSTLTVTTPCYFGYIQTAVTAQAYAPNDGGDVRMVMIGDSYLAGSAYGPWLAGGSIPALIAKRLGFSDCWNYGIGGTGYLAVGAGPYYTYEQRLAQAAALNPDVLFVMGSVNDKAQSAGAITAAVTSFIRAARASLPTTPIVVVGCQPIDSYGVMTPTNSGFTAAQIEAEISAGVTAAADSRTVFIPMATVTPPWVCGTWNNGSLGMSGTPVNTAYYVAGDGVHPPEMGTQGYAARIAQETRRLLINLY